MREHKQVRIEGTEVHYLDVGAGPPLVLLQGGLMSSDAVWDGHPGSYLTHLDAFASRFRVLMPDARGCGRTPNPGGGAVGYAQLADDVVAFSAALGVERPLVCGFSDGGAIASVVSIRAPDRVRAVVDHAGFDVLDPRSRTFPMGRQVFGGRPDATQADPDAAVGFLAAHGMAEFARRVQLDHGAQPGGWKGAMASCFQRFTYPSDLTIEALRAATAPTLILTGDRDMFCSAEDAVAAYRTLRTGELAIVPGLGHGLSTAAIDLTVDFLVRQAG